MKINAEKEAIENAKCNNCGDEIYKDKVSGCWVHKAGYFYCGRTEELKQGEPVPAGVAWIRETV